MGSHENLQVDKTFGGWYQEVTAQSSSSGKGVARHDTFSSRDLSRFYNIRNTGVLLYLEAKGRKSEGHLPNLSF